MAFLNARTASKILGAARQAPCQWWKATGRGRRVTSFQELYKLQAERSTHSDPWRPYNCLYSSSHSSPLLPVSARFISMSPLRLANSKQDNKEAQRRTEVVSQDEGPFDSITDRIPERPVTAAEAGSYSVVILIGLAVAAAAGFAVVKELVLEPKEYQVFNKALDRVKNDNQVTVRLGTPITGYGQESRNRATRQRISNRTWKDEDGIERIQVQFHVRGPSGTGLVHCEMFKDPADRGRLKFTYLLVDVTSPVQTRIMLESYVPTASFG